MRRIFNWIVGLVYRLVYMLEAVVFTLSFAVGVRLAYLHLYGNTAYFVVVIFFLTILFSNLLAKLALGTIQTYENNL